MKSISEGNWRLDNSTGTPDVSRDLISRETEPSLRAILNQAWALPKLELRYLLMHEAHSQTDGNRRASGQLVIAGRRPALTGNASDNET